MNRRHKRLLVKQSLKYLVIVLIAILGMGLYRILWDIPNKAFYWAMGIIGSIIFILAVFDAISVRDILSIFKG